MRRSAMALACVALVACAACGKSDDTAAANIRQRDQQNASDASARTSETPQAQQVSYEGCLQKGAGMVGTDYLLTMTNEPPGAAGTSGSVTSTGSSVEREQMRVAAQTYRLGAKGDVKLADMVGKQVRVTGVVSERAHVPTGAGAIGSDLDTQRSNRDRADQENKGPRLNTADLGKIDVSSASIIADSCGALGREVSGRTDGEMAGTDRTPRVRR